MSLQNTTIGAENEAKGFVQLAGPDNSVLFFSGPPLAFTGFIPVVNTSPEKQKIRSISIIAEKLRSAGGIPFGEIPFRARLRGGQQARLRAKLPLDPQTPPGRYDFAVTVGPRTLPAVADIPEVVELRIEPRVVTIVASAKNSSYIRKVVCENRGNVVLLGGSQCEVPIFEDERISVAVLNGLHKADRKSIRSMLKAALDELAGLKVGNLIIKRKPMALSPGQKVEVDVQFNLPCGLKPQHHYSASVELYNANLRIEIYTTASPEPLSNSPT